MRGGPRSRLGRVGDLALPLAVALFLLGIVDDEPGLSGAAEPLGVLAALVQGAALWWRRSHPEAVMVVALAGGLVVHLVAPNGLFPYAALIALFTLAAARGPRTSLPALAATLALSALNFRTASDGDAAFAMAFPVLAWALGDAARSRAAEASRRAVAEEQARIARELHDVLAHSVSVIVVQAAAAGDVFDERPDQARRALRAIEEAGRDALGELRRMLGAVRPEERAPQPGLERLGDLVRPLREAGLDVTVRAEPADDVRLPSAVDLSAYRIVQEALTNTLRHARARRAEVTVRAGPDVLELDVRDDGRGGAAGANGGRGIAGMRERATLLGGTLEAGPEPGGGFRVHARLPLEAPR